MAGKVVDVTAQNFEAEVLNASVPVLVDLWAAWCGPCRMIAPVVEELAGTYAGKLKVAKLNVDEAPDVAAQYRVMNIPTLLLFKGGKEIDRIVGAQPKEALASHINRAIA